MGMDIQAAIAFNRFGLGRRRGEEVPADPRAWLRAQLEGPDQAPPGPSTQDGLALVWAIQKTDRAMFPEIAKSPAALQFAGVDQKEARAQLAWAIVTPAGFRERLVWFWFNHFTVAGRNRPARACLGGYIREAIRPNVTGKFRDLLLAVMRHPAMLSYLDNETSIGPDSPAGLRLHRGLNENLARECLELHTVSPAAGYTQADVTNFARILTGWSYDTDPAHPGFHFRPNAHEPGSREVMGRTWPEGEAGGVALLSWLAGHPATTRHLATKLVRHFVADDPAPDDVARIDVTLRATDGDLAETARALIDLRAAWQPLTKLRTPKEYVVAAMRAVGAHPEYEPNIHGIVANLGEPVFQPPFPIGWPDRAADWAGAEALLQRVQFAYQFAGRVTDQDPGDIATQALGPLLRDETRTQIRNAGSRRDGLTLALACPEFQRR